MKIRSESAILFERTLVYQTVFENFVVLIQQKKKQFVVHLPALFDTEAVYERYCCPTGKNGAC